MHLLIKRFFINVSNQSHFNQRCAKDSIKIEFESSDFTIKELIQYSKREKNETRILCLMCLTSQFGKKEFRKIRSHKL